MVNTEQGAMCGVRSKCKVKVRAGQRPQELGSLREEMAKGSLCHLLPTHPRLWATKREASLAPLRHLLKVLGLVWPVNIKEMASQEARWPLGVFPWWRSEMDNRPTLRTLFLGSLKVCDKY